MPVVLDLEALEAGAADRALDEARRAITVLSVAQPQSLDAGRPSNFEGNTRLRIEGTKNLMAAAAVVGARRVIAQSIAFIYADAPGARVETDPLDSNPARAPTIDAVKSLEQQTLGVPGIDGVILRYGRLYGPGAFDMKGGIVVALGKVHAGLMCNERGLAAAIEREAARGAGIDAPLQSRISGAELMFFDGTLYRGSQLFPQTLPFLAQLRNLGLGYTFLTNNTSRSKAGASWVISSACTNRMRSTAASGPGRREEGACSQYHDAALSAHSARCCWFLDWHMVTAAGRKPVCCSPVSSSRLVVARWLR